VAFKFLGDTTAERLMRRCDICGMLYAQDDSEGSFDDVPELAKEDDQKDAVTPARTPTKKAANPKATKATKAKAKPRASAAKAKPRASARKAAAPKKGAAVKKAVAVVDTKVAKPPAAKKKAAKKKKAPGLLIADFNIAPRTFATTSSMRARE